MADIIAPQFLMLSNASVSPAGLTHYGASQLVGDTLVKDLDVSGTASPGDYFGDSTTPYTGFTVTIGGNTYAVFQSTFSGNAFIPHFGELSATSVPSGYPTTADSNASVVNCFLEDARIATPIGDMPIGALKIGGQVLTSEGATRAIKWIGRQTVSTLFGPAERLMPVRFDAGSLGDGLPTADLTVTADHGMLVDGVICHAGALVNGTTITRVPLAEMGEAYTVYHVETEAHEIILANGALAETFIDNVSRRTFDNFAEFEALYGDVPEMEELPHPRAMSARQVPERIRAKLRMLKTA
ncbi:Hint domain-containing protein [Nioella sp.]|uniref:Hint domain-containing protein n=1 Tax=Nioella sp. TaxID=1912091 RepID=UPI003A835763